MDNSNDHQHDRAVLVSSLLELSDLDDHINPIPTSNQLNTYLLAEWVTPQTYIPPQNNPKPSRVRNTKLPDRINGNTCPSFNDLNSLHENVTFRYIRDNGTYRRLKYETDNDTLKTAPFKASFSRTSITNSIPTSQKTELSEKHSYEPEYSTFLDKASALYNVDNSRLLYMKKPSTVNELLIKHEVNQTVPSQSSQASTKIKSVPVCPYRDKASASAPQTRSSKQKAPINAPNSTENYISTSSLLTRLQEKLQPYKTSENKSSIHKEHTWHESLPTELFNISKLNSPRTELNSKLKPIERITPAMRENYDNVYAKERLGQLKDKNHQPIEKQVAFDDAPVTQTTERSTVQYRVSKLGTSREKSNSLPLINHLPPDFQSFLPSISGKGIGPLASTSTRY